MFWFLVGTKRFNWQWFSQAVSSFEFFDIGPIPNPIIARHINVWALHAISWILLYWCSALIFFEFSGHLHVCIHSLIFIFYFLFYERLTKLVQLQLTVPFTLVLLCHLVYSVYASSFSRHVHLFIDFFLMKEWPS